MRKELWGAVVFLMAAGALIAAAALISSRKTAGTGSGYVPLEPLRIAVGADVHALAPTLTDDGAYFRQVVTNADGKLTQYSDAITDAFVTQLLREAPNVLILPGDLTFNGARESHAALAEQLRRLSDAGVRVLVLPGNHDLNNPMAARFAGDGFERVDSLTSEEFAALYAPFGYADALSRDDASLSYAAALAPGLRALLIDTNTPDAPGKVLPETLQWAESALEAAREAGDRVLCVTHQTILQHNSVFSDGFVIEGREALSMLLQRYGVPCSLCGHMHIQHIKTLGSLTEIAGSALSVWPCQYGVLELTQDGGSYRTERVQIPDVPDFDTAAESFFLENTLRQGSVSADDPALLDYLCAMNRGYYSGRMDETVREDALLAAWEEADPFIGAYLRSLAEDAGKDFTKTEFSFDP